ncbi:3-deoxy-7-phosphoheptulonate synthase [Cryptosporangium sp. NPDC051539]|uniref:3-deoxy-7-phosphoheptulonate synthase n=1 Tax=Cryptosporangium sp. NPDC051539 TaxID=3363962 RepID=UPI0037ABFACD
MVIVMSPDAPDSALQTVVSTVEEAGGSAFVSRGVTRTIVGVVAGEPVLASLEVEGLPGVAEVVRITSPYKLVSRENHLRTSTVNVRGVPIGPDSVTLIAGPCAVETPEQTLEAALMAKRAGAALMRGGAYKPRTSPYAFQGLGVDGLKILADVRTETGLPVVTEIVDPADIDVVAEYADMLQVGTRNMQNFALLQAVGSVGKPVLLKRGLTATYEEWLMAAEYIAQRGNLDIVLCERGVRSFEPALRNMLDVSAVPMVHQLSHLPILIDPSHAAGRRELVVPLAKAAIGVGAEGLLIDVHPHPETAKCDGPQALHGTDLEELANAVHTLPPALGKTLTAAPAA